MANIQKVRQQQLGRRFFRNSQTRQDTEASSAIVSAINDHEADATAHPASHITYDNSTSGLSAIDAQGAIDELDADLDTLKAAPDPFPQYTSAASDEDVTGSWAMTLPLYLGPRATDGTWRLALDGTSLVIQRRESGAWVTKSTITA